LLNPYIPKEGKVLLFGTTSIGKSPLMWTMAFCVAEGVPFFGLPVQQTNVLFIELDSSRVGTKRRLKKRPELATENVGFIFLPGLNIPNVDKKHFEEIQAGLRDLDPGLIIVNSLRKCHSLDDKDSATTKIVYEWFDRVFPGRAVLICHHERKSPVNAKDREGGVDRENFSGSAAWSNDAQVTLHLRSHGGDKKANLALWHVKSQETEMYQPLPLKLHRDGTRLSCHLFEECEQIRMMLQDYPSLTAKAKDYKIAGMLDCSVRTARRRRALVEGGKLFLLTQAEVDAGEAAGDDDEEAAEDL
jgi:hypothetical protein